MKKQKINYWTEMGLAAKKELQSQKIYDAKKHHRRHPKLSDLTFEKVEPPQERSKEEWKALFKQMREEAKKRKEERPYSENHKKWISNLYGKQVDALKKSAIEAAHERAIERIRIKRSIQASMKAFTKDSQKPNILIVNRENNWNISPFMTIPSSHTLDTLIKIAKEMAKRLTVSMKDFFTIEVWDRQEYMKKLAGDKMTNYRFEIGKC